MISALELMSKNIFCGSVRIVYAIIYTLFLVGPRCPRAFPSQSQLFQGFGLTIGSDFYLVIDRRARRAYYRSSIPENLTYTHGQFLMTNGTSPFSLITGVLGQGNAIHLGEHIIKGKRCS